MKIFTKKKMKILKRKIVVFMFQFITNLIFKT